RLVLREGSVPVWETVLPERAGVLTEYIVQDDALYIVERTAGGLGLLRMAYGTATASAVALPTPGSVHLLRAQTGTGASFTVESWASPPHVLYADRDSARAVGLDDGFSARHPADVISDHVQAPSQDGTLVPVSVVYGPSALRNGKLDGTAPLLIDAYGAFSSTNDDSFDPLVQYWISQGGVYAYAAVRGGGELGEAWHQAATRENKQRSIDDMIGAIEHLIARRYTSAKRVSIIGVSFGANIPGMVMLQRPDLLGAVLYEVGQPDEIRGAVFDPTAARNIAEIGDLDTPEGIRSLMKMSPYHQIPARVDLPAVIVHTAAADYNFGTQMLTAKYVARLQKANSGGRPVLWVQTPGGHRALFGSGAEWAGVALSFLLWNSGVERYQPGPR
ncbi:MAG: prolyl oligopeptidase family serine peptidase, partial [Gemmatimonadaceae bacterium]